VRGDERGGGGRVGGDGRPAQAKGVREAADHEGSELPVIAAPEAACAPSAGTSSVKSVPHMQPAALAEARWWESSRENDYGHA
jgi:hypothetical protein